MAKVGRKAGSKVFTCKCGKKVVIQRGVASKKCPACGADVERSG